MTHLKNVSLSYIAQRLGVSKTIKVAPAEYNDIIYSTKVRCI